MTCGTSNIILVSMYYCFVVLLSCVGVRVASMKGWKSHCGSEARARSGKNRSVRVRPIFCCLCTNLDFCASMPHLRDARTLWLNDSFSRDREKAERRWTVLGEEEWYQHTRQGSWHKNQRNTSARDSQLEPVCLLPKDSKYVRYGPLYHRLCVPSSGWGALACFLRKTDCMRGNRDEPRFWVNCYRWRTAHR